MSVGGGQGCAARSIPGSTDGADRDGVGARSVCRFGCRRDRMTGFGKQLLASVHPPWVEHYLRYKLLKKLLKLIRSSETEGHVQIEAARLKLKGLEPPEELQLRKHAADSEQLSRFQLESFFEELLDIERVRFKAFSKSQWLSVEEAQEQAVDAEADSSDAVRARMAARRDTLEDRRLLLSFQDLQYVAFFKIVKKFDKVTGRSLLPTIMQQLDGEIATGELGGPRRSEIDAASLRSQSARQIKDATRLSKRALVTQAPLLTVDEKKERFKKTEMVETGGLEGLDALSANVDTETLTDNVTRIKAQVFSGFIAEVIDGVKISDPETAAALEQLQIAHHTLFRTTHSSGGVLKTPRESASSQVSDRASSVEHEGYEAAVGFNHHRKTGCSQFVRASARQFMPACLLWLPEYQCKKQLKKDIVAGATLAIMGVPQGLAVSPAAASLHPC